MEENHLFQRVTEKLSPEELGLLSHNYEKWSLITRKSTAGHSHDVREEPDLENLISAMRAYRAGNKQIRKLMNESEQMNGGGFQLHFVGGTEDPKEGMNAEELKIIAIRNKLEKMRGKV
ncbi:MAG: hypothetical protein V1835_00720 [Candidatus Micrarchaeota archaeon]